MDIKKIFHFTGILLALLILASCGGARNLVVPRAVSTANAISMGSLNLKKGDYEILNNVTETASVIVKYSKNKLKITSSDGDFIYLFKYDLKTGWTLDKFRGTATFGYLLQDVNESAALPSAEEFARRVAISKLIDVIKDYGADGALEPIVTTRVSNGGSGEVEYHATASAKIVKIHSTTN